LGQITHTPRVSRIFYVKGKGSGGQSSAACGSPLLPSKMKLNAFDLFIYLFIVQHLGEVGNGTDRGNLKELV